MSSKLLTLLMCLVLLTGCGRTDRVADSADEEAEAAPRVEKQVQAGLDNLLDQLTVEPETRWQELPLDADRLVLLELVHQDLVVRGEWRVSADAITPSSQFARDLETLEADAGRATLLTLVPAEWLPADTAAAPQPQTTAEPAAKPAPAPEPEPMAATAPAAPARPTTPRPAAPRPELIGVISGDVQTAMFRLGDRYVSLKPGEMQGDLKLVSVAPQEAVIIYRGQRRELGLQVPASSEMSLPEPAAPPDEDTETVHLDNSSLDDAPAVELPGGWRRFDTTE